jgi:hypothetical protein
MENNLVVEVLRELLKAGLGSGLQVRGIDGEMGKGVNAVCFISKLKASCPSQRIMVLCWTEPQKQMTSFTLPLRYFCLS